MKKLSLLMFVLLSLVSVAFAQDKSAGEKKIGIVNISEVLNKYLRRSSLETKFKGESDKFEAKIKLKKEEIEQIRQDMTLSKDDGETEKLSLELLKAKRELELFGELNSEVMQREYVKAQLEMIKEIKKTIQDYGEENKYFLILQAQPKDVKQSNIQEALLTINLADVMYYDRGADISEKIIERLNARWKNSNPTTPSK
jgi:Skp family chaperone for outer membrane proteins